MTPADQQNHHNKVTTRNTRVGLGRGVPRRPPKMSAKRKRHVSVRFTDMEYDALAAKARTAGVSVSVLLRTHANRLGIAPNLLGGGRVGLFWGRIAVMLTVIAERSRAIADKEVALAVIAQLVAVESELNEHQPEALDA